MATRRKDIPAVEGNLAQKADVESGLDVRSLMLEIREQIKADLEKNQDFRRPYVGYRAEFERGERTQSR